jgi:PAS domain S-box-containing protein
MSGQRSIETLEGLGIGYYRSDNTGTFVEINECGASMLGYTTSEMIGRITTLDTNVSSEYREKLKRQAEAEGFVASFVSPTRRKDGSVFYAEWSLRRLVGADGEPLGYEGVFRDVSEQFAQAKQQQELMERLRRANEWLGMLSHVQEDLLSALGHDLKTPPGIVLGFCELLLRGRYGPLRQEQERPLRAIHRNTAQLAEMLDILLDFSRSLRNLDLNPAAPYPLNAVLAKMQERLLKEARQRKVRMTGAVAADVLTTAPPVVLESLLEHAVRNSIFLCEEGGEIIFSGERTAQKAHLVVTMPEQHDERPPAHRLLTTFFALPPPQPGSAEHAPYRLGYAAARYLATLVNGQMTSRQVGDKGAEVRITLPGA